jgi:[ribosomal protein S18]-alanine N-acetyltransferase
MPELRDYRPSDFEQLFQLDQRCFQENIAYSRGELAHYLRGRNAICLLACEGDKLLGFILGDVTPRGSGHIVTLDISPEARQAGLATALMAALQDRFSALSCRAVLLEVAVNNHAALAFYKKHGFSVLKTLRRYYPGGLDGLLMGKNM